MTTEQMVDEIERLQGVQRRNPPSSAAWQGASEALAPLFAEMARRQRANGGKTDWREWAQEPAQ